MPGGDGSRTALLLVALAAAALPGAAQATRPSQRPLTVQFDSATATSPETTTPLQVPISLSAKGNASVSFSTAGGTATPGTCGSADADYEPVAATAVTFAGASQAMSPPVKICHNPQHEPSETIVLRLSNPSGASLGANSTETVTITDDDHPPTLTITATTPRVAEGDVAQFTVTPSAASNAPLDVHYATADGAATAPADYSPTSGDLHWPAGDASSQTISVQTLTDSSNEPDESFAVQLSSPVNAVFSPGSDRAGTVIAGTRPPLASDVLWTADAELPWDLEWASYACQSTDRFSQVMLPLAQGFRAYRLEVQDGDNSSGERCELGMANPPRPGFPLYNEGDERWISWQVYLPSNFPIDANTWNVITQLKQLGSLGTPVLSMEVQQGRFIQFNSDTNGSSCCTVELGSWPAVQNRWVRFTYHVKFSPDPAVGFIEVYGDVDGSGQRLLLPLTHTWTMKKQHGRAVQSHSRIGIYRDSAIQGTADIYYDGYTIATTKEAAEANAFRPASVP